MRESLTRKKWITKTKTKRSGDILRANAIHTNLMAKKTTPPNNTHAAEAVKIATALIDNWEKGTRTRFSAIREYEENYLGKVRPRTSGRSNFPVPVLGRYVDEIKSRLDESPNLIVDSSVSISRKLIGRKATAIIKDLKKPSKGNWNKYDRLSRRHAIFAGYNAVDFYSEDVDGNFRLNFDPIHHTEFVFEMGGGNDLEKHMGVGRFPIWRTKGQLESRVESNVYDKNQVDILVAKYNASDFKKNEIFFATKTEHLKALGIDVQNNSYAGQPVYPLAQMQLTLNFGKGDERYLLTFDYWSGVWVRFQPLKEVFPSGMYSIDFWQTSEDDEVTCKSPCDDIFPFAEGIRVKVNQLFDNHTKKIYGQRGYDPNFVPDPSQLIWARADQLTKMRAYGGKPLSAGVYEFKTDDMTEPTIKFLEYMDGFLTSVVGINPNDVSLEVQKVGAMFGQLQKTAARLGSQNKSFNEMWQRLGYRALYEMKEFLTEKQSIQIIGSRGVEWESFVGSELKDPADFDILTQGSNVEFEMNEARKKRQNEIMQTVTKDPDLKKQTNLRAVVENLFKAGEWTEDEIARLMDVEHYGNEEMLARADLACEQIVKGKEPQLYPGADISFMQYILDFAGKLDDNEAEKRIKLLTYGRAHKSIVIKNMAEKGMNELAQKGIPPDQANVPPPPGMPVPGASGADPAAPPAPPPAPVGPNAQPSPDVMNRAAQRGPAMLGHMPIAPVGRFKPRAPSPDVHSRVKSRGARIPQPIPAQPAQG